jgi:hypothetical protein
VAHFPGGLDPAPILLHRHRDPLIIAYPGPTSGSIAFVDHICLAATVACYCFFFHRADNLKRVLFVVGSCHLVEPRKLAHIPYAPLGGVHFTF